MKRTAGTVVVCLFFLSVFSALHASGSEEISAGAQTALSLRESTIKYSQVIETKYFDIIYAPQSELSARILAANADALYEKAAAEFETQPWMHFPVVLNPSAQNSNGFFTTSPYTHICVYDTPNDVTELAVNSDSLVNVFYHELIHAITANIHKKDKDNKPDFFGDIYQYPFTLNSRLFTIEGATVSRESSDGEGRVNSGYSISMLIQSKLEGKFPSWQDISGPRDIYPTQTASYNFGGAFNAWLQNEFGMSKYADFWKECSVFHITGMSGAFKKVYGMTITQAWKLFEETVPIPETDSLDKTTVLKDNLRTNNLTIRPGNESGIVYLYNFSSIRFIPFADPSSEHELFSCYGSHDQLSFSPDGRYLAVSSCLTGYDDVYSVRLFDMQTESFCGAEIPYSRKAVVTEGADGTDYLYCIESAAGYEFVTLYRLQDVLAAKDELPEPVSRVELTSFDEIYATAPSPDGVVCLRKTNGVWYVTRAYINGNTESWRLPENVMPVGLSADAGAVSGDTLKFYTSITSHGMNAGSESEPGAIARLGEIVIQGGQATLSYQKMPFSGGVQSPVVSENDAVYSISRLYECDGLYKFSMADSDMTEPVALEKEVPVQYDVQEVLASVAFVPQRYHDILYMNRGTIFPMAGVAMSGLTTISLENLLGITYWTANPQDTVNVQVSAGVPVPALEMPLELFASFFGTTSSLTGSNLNWDISGVVRLNDDFTLKTLESHIAVQDQFLLSNPGESISLSNVSVFADDSGNVDSEIRLAIANSFGIRYTLSKRRGPNILATGGVTAGLQFLAEYDVLNTVTLNVKKNAPVYEEQLYAQPGLFAGFRLARLLPLSYKPTVTYNWPLEVNASLFCATDTFLSAEATIDLLAIEIQKGLPVLPLFCQRLVIDAGYSFWNGAPADNIFSPWALFRTGEIFSQFNTLQTVSSLTAGVNFVISPAIANTYSAQFNVGINGRYYLRNDFADNKYEISILGIFRL